MDLASLADYLRRGGAAILNHPATYAVADGAIIAPARYAGRSGSEFVFEQRWIDGEFRPATLIDSKGSQSNRSEEGLLAARHDGSKATLIPTIEVSYPVRKLLDLELPHRAFDAHVRAASQDGSPVVGQPWYRSLRDATAADLSPVFTTSPATLAFGGWDSSRKSGQLRLRSLYVSELFAVVSGDESRRLSRRSGARLDPLGQDFHVSPDEFERLLAGQREHMSENTVKKLDEKLVKARKEKEGTTLSAADLGLGGIPPSLETAYGVSVPEVRRARTYSLAGLRRLRFGGGEDDDVAGRAALLATLLLGAAYADADPEIRAYCDLAAPRGSLFLDDEQLDIEVSIDACEVFLAGAIAALPERLAWTGQTVALEGDPSLERSAIADADNED